MLYKDLNMMQVDIDSQNSLQALLDHQKIKSSKIPGVRTVLVVLSSRGMVFDVQSLRFNILATYPDAVVFFKSTIGIDLDSRCPDSIDLLIDLTGPGQKQGLFYSKTLRKMARFAVGRNCGLFRRGAYDRVLDEKKELQNPTLDLLDRERIAQKKVLALAGVSVSPCGEVSVDLGLKIALDLPPLKMKH